MLEQDVTTYERILQTFLPELRLVNGTLLIGGGASRVRFEVYDIFEAEHMRVCGLITCHDQEIIVTYSIGLTPIIPLVLGLADPEFSTKLRTIFNLK
jgi:hypothetical protein